MAAKLFHTPGPVAAGIFADMTVDGPEIGTLVVVFDRAKNLPNRRTMGKQNSYCAARLGKEAKKTDTDLRGGQTPRWDQELRFTVHDSPDYHNLKISVFSEDKKTDLIGEAWVGLTEILVAGGGKNDLWQGLNCKGKYAGELRMELTYYDSRPKPENTTSSMPVDEGVRQPAGGSHVKRRPLPANPQSAGGSITPDSIPGPLVPGRAKHGPRDYRTPPRANSMPPEMPAYTSPQYPHHDDQFGSSPPTQTDYHQPQSQYVDPVPYHYPQSQSQDFAIQQHDFLPTLPPSNRQRAQQRYVPRASQAHQTRPASHVGLPHSHSAPMVPTTQPEEDYATDDHILYTDYPEVLPDVDQLHDQMQQRWGHPSHGHEYDYNDPYTRQHHQPHQIMTAPPPPTHSNSAPAVPQSSSPYGPGSPSNHYGGTPPTARQQYTPNGSPFYGQQQTPTRQYPSHAGSLDAYSSPPEHGTYVTPPSLSPGGLTPPSARSAAARNLPYRHSVAEPYSATPSRPHPLSQEVTRARSPMPQHPHSTPFHQPEYVAQPEDMSRDMPPLIKPRAVSPAPRTEIREPQARRAKSAFSIQYPVRAFESSDANPLSTSNHQSPVAPPNRKSVSPRPSPATTNNGVPFGPDSFDVHNPNARPSTLSNGASPQNPYRIRPGVETREESRGPIVGWHGQEIDPSDHLPVDSWAPEPEKKTPTKTYGLGRDADFGPRQVTPSGNGRISKDTVIHFRRKTQPEPQSEPDPSPASGRNRLVKKQHNNRHTGSPLAEHNNYNPTPIPYEQYGYTSPEHVTQNYHGSFTNSSPGYSPQYHHGSSTSPYHGGSPGEHGAPGVPPKIPIAAYQHDYGHHDALAREISAIDIGPSSTRDRRGGSVPPTVAYVPVRSHQDRRSFY